jgi:hypothetical protein
MAPTSQLREGLEQIEGVRLYCQGQLALKELPHRRTDASIHQRNVFHRARFIFEMAGGNWRACEPSVMTDFSNEEQHSFNL